MPRGKAQIEMIGASNFCQDENLTFEGINFKVSKATGKQGEKLEY